MEGSATTGSSTQEATTSEKVKVQLSERRGYELPKQYENIFNDVPELKDSILNQDKTISDREKTLSELQAWKQTNEPKLKQEKPVKPDRFDNPDEHDEWMITEAETRAEKKAAEIAARREIHTLERQTAATLVEKYFGDQTKSLSPEAKKAFYDGKLQGIADKLAAQGGINDDGTFKQGAIDAAFSTAFRDELITMARKEGLSKMGTEIENANNAPGTIPGGERPQTFNNLDEALSKNPGGVFKKACEEIGKEVQRKRQAS